MITVKNLTKIYQVHTRQKNFFLDVFARQYKEIHALNNISFDIGEDELVGFIGPNGAGKTTTLKILSGILYPTSGMVSVMNTTPFEKNIRFLKQIAFVMGQRNQLIWDLSTRDSLQLQKTIYEINDEDFKKNVGELTELLDANDLLDKPVKTLSLGQRMKMELVVGLLHRPKIIFFDEPTIGLDIFSQEAIRNFIKSYQSETKATIILTSHYLEDVKRLAKRLIIIHNGSIVYDGSLSNIVEQYTVEKRVVVTLDKMVNDTELRGIGVPYTLSYPKVTFLIKKGFLPEKIKHITQSLPFSDLTVEDESIEEIIKTFFKEHHGSSHT
ncbi:ATP-binding cassette domain-containing protein [Candidatus Roizmanbacteria bacterium]|nr:ATP-binding cassette domain-containing protein [Candidatus Roizmanbacteria bacterium]